VSPIHLPTELAVALDIVAWLVIHLGAAWVGTRLPNSLYKRDRWLCRPRDWERDGDLYVRVFAVKRWKHLLPDGAQLFRGGFAKKYLRDSSSMYLRTFIGETRRAEVTHWLAMLPAPIFFIWNLWPVGIFMLVYAAAANMPCIITQRYNRARLTRVVARQQARPVGTDQRDEAIEPTATVV
jgi:glycosyl-4,4'-diaponeurosporenoate acyltransferase